METQTSGGGEKKTLPKKKKISTPIWTTHTESQQEKQPQPQCQVQIMSPQPSHLKQSPSQHLIFEAPYPHNCSPFHLPGCSPGPDPKTEFIIIIVYTTNPPKNQVSLKRGQRRTYRNLFMLRYLQRTNHRLSTEKDCQSIIIIESDWQSQNVTNPYLVRGAPMVTTFVCSTSSRTKWLWRFLEEVRRT